MKLVDGWLSFSSPKTLRRALFVVPILQVFISLVFLPTLGKREIFPFFTWNLFSSAERYQLRMNLRIEEENPLGEIRVFSAMDLDVIQDASRRRRLADILWAFEEAEKEEHKEELKGRIFEMMEAHVSSPNYSYQIFREECDPVLFFQGQSCKTLEILEQGRRQ